MVRLAKLTEEDFQAALQGSQVCSTQQDLQRTRSLDVTEAKALGNVLRNNTTLRTLNLALNNDLGDDGAAALSEALRENVGLEILILNSCGIGNDGFDSLCKVFSNHQTLRELHLGYNHINAAGMNSLKGCLCDSSAKMTSLKLDYNCIDEPKGIDNEAAKILSEALEQNETLKQLDLHGNQIGDSGGKHIALALRHNHSLLSLNLDGNLLGQVASYALLETLRTNHTITSFIMNENAHVDGLTREECQRAVELNMHYASLAPVLDEIRN